MNDDFIVEDLGGVSREFMRGVRELRPRVRDRVVGFREVGFLLNRGVGDGVEKDRNPSVGDEFSTEGDQVERMPAVVHVRQLRPRVVDRIVSEHSCGRVRPVVGHDASCDVDHTVLAGDACESDRLIAGHAGAVAPVSSRCVVHLDQARGFDGGV